MLTPPAPIGTAGQPLGTDELGRDMLSRLIVGARLSLFIGITPVICAFVLGTVDRHRRRLCGRHGQHAIMRTIDVFYAFPSVLLAIALSGALGAGIVNSLISLTIVFIPQIARVAESVTTQVRTRDYVEAARASGASAFTIVRVHVLGNVLGPIFVYATSLIAVSMILASGLSFLGLGVKPPEPEWGLMLNTLRTAIYVQPWVAALPGAMIFITSISFNLLSDGLRSAMDIRTRHEQKIRAMLERSRTSAAPRSRCCTVNGLTKHFPVRGGLFAASGTVRAVDGVDFTCARARRSAWSANRAAASRPPRAC